MSWSALYPPPAKRLRKSSDPIRYQRHDSCKLWHIPKNRKAKVDSPTYNMCATCRTLFAYLNKKNVCQQSLQEEIQV